MSDKSEKNDTPPSAEKDAASGGAASPSGLKAWLPTIAGLVLAPVVTLAVAQYVLLPKLQKTLSADEPAAASGEKSSAPAGEKPAKPEKSAKPEKAAGKGEKKGAEGGYHFDGVVVNLAGTMGTRYLKTSFLVTGADTALTAKFEAAKAQLGDVTLAVLASLTLADLEEPGSKNIIREKLLAAYNQALGQKVAENLYFSDFVVQ